jgi:hypothetical protein
VVTSILGRTDAILRQRFAFCVGEPNTSPEIPPKIHLFAQNDLNEGTIVVNWSFELHRTQSSQVSGCPSLALHLTFSPFTSHSLLPHSPPIETLVDECSLASWKIDRSIGLPLFPSPLCRIVLARYWSLSGARVYRNIEQASLSL